MDIELRCLLQRPDFTLNIDTRLPAQGITAIFGPSGSGKTSLLRWIAGLEQQGNGRLVVGGEIWQDGNRRLAAHRRPLGYVFQEASLFDHLSVEGNLHYGLRRLPGLSRAALDEAITLLSIGHLLARRPSELSGGERQRVAIARALALQPRLLLLDEPLAALDLARKQEILPYLEQLHTRLHCPILYVSHAADEVARLADHLLVLAAGEVRASGPLRETLCRLDLPIQLGEDAGAVLDARIADIDATWHLARVEFDGGSLWLRDPGLPPGRPVRIRVLARDVSLATAAPSPSSIQNILTGKIEGVVSDDHPATCMVRVRVGSASVLARITQRAQSQLKLAPGVPVWLQVKSVALLG